MFATSSFDCCCHIWSFADYKKMGSLILGHEMMNNNWQLRVDEDKRKNEAVDYMKKLKKRLDNKYENEEIDSNSSSENLQEEVNSHT